MRRIGLYAIILALGLIALVVNQWRQRAPLYHTQSYVFGTLVDIAIYGETNTHAADVSAHILEDFQSLHTQLHAWKAPASTSQNTPNAGELIRINTAIAAGEKATQLSSDMMQILGDLKRLSIQSDDLFNPTIGHLIATWGFQRDTYGAVKVDAHTLEKWLNARPTMHDIMLDHDTNTVESSNPYVKLDLGGYAKGYALDRAIETLKKANVQHALINIGGNIIALGQHGEQPWRVGIQHPRQPNAIATLDLPSGWAIGTSGDYQRFFMLNDQRYCHIIDPRTGYPVQHTQAVTVLVPPQPKGTSQAGVLSDVASKPIFIAQDALQAKLAAKMHINDFLIINAQGKIVVSAALAQKLTWLNPDEPFSLTQ